MQILKQKAHLGILVRWLIANLSICLCPIHFWAEKWFIIDGFEEVDAKLVLKK